MARPWRSLEDLADTPEFREMVEREFPTFLDELATPASRRQFLRIMGASMAFAGLTACRWPQEEIVPFAYRPEGYVPGVPLQFATALEMGGAALGLLVTSWDGRPIKVEGNPVHPASLGATNAWAQASILDMYDPDRSQAIARRGVEGVPSWEELAAFLRERATALRAGGGRGLVVLSESSSSPTLAVLRDQLLAAFPQARWVEWEPASRDDARTGSALAFGAPHRTHLRLDRAEVIVSLGDDFLFEHPAGVRHQRDRTRSRRAEGAAIGRLYAIESGYSVTGANADHRIALRPDELPAFAGCLAAEVVLNLGVPLPAGGEGLRPALERFLNHPLMGTSVWTVARELVVRRGRSIVTAGPRQRPEVHALVHVLNAALGNAGVTVAYTREPDEARPPHAAAVRALAADLSAGLVDTLVVLGGNVVADAPADLDMPRALARARHSIHLSLHANETSRACAWHVPRQHAFESWGDCRAWDGTVSIVQPLIEPLFGGKSPIEMISALLGEEARGYDLVRRTFAGGGVIDEVAWRRALHDGVVPGTAWPEVLPPIVDASWGTSLVDRVLSERPPAEGALQVLFTPDPSVYDGRFANNGWLQELPDPLTKLTWDNAALLAPVTGAALGLTTGDVVRLSAEGRSIEIPIFLLPGHAPGCATLPLGYGSASGRVGGGVGVDVTPLRTTGAFHVATASVQRTGRKHRLATTQDHFVIDPLGGRERAERSAILVREIAPGEVVAAPVHGEERAEVTEPPQLHREFAYPGHKWGMAIDLDACVGCNACMVACQAENNVPVVGKDEVARGREMHWIRVDRYFQGSPAAPDVVFQPMTCHHCENAPCEPVCPVAATLHDREGLNVMVYNRCVGTRYCSNNCPYKVRRFNWFNNHEEDSPLLQMVYNPEVSVRGRGVMEKCTFCTQRIEAVKIRAKNERRKIEDGEIVPACAQACPSEAIVFGDLNDPGSRVRRLQDGPRAYALLEELNTRPRLRYLAKIRNRASGGAAEPESADAAHQG